MNFPDFQIEGSLWLAERHLALLADDMGVGKTAQAIRAFDLIAAKSVLVVCPAVARVNWVREFRRFSRSGADLSLQRDATASISTQNLVTSYELATRSANSTLSKQTWDVLILDESHFLKSTDAKRSKAIFGKDGLCRRAKYVWALSGTPMPNHPGELWIILYSFGATTLNYNAFVERYCEYTEGPRGKIITGINQENKVELRSVLKKIMLRRPKELVLKQLPPIEIETFFVEPGEVDFHADSSFIKYVIGFKDESEKLRAEIKHQEDVLRQMLGLTSLTNASLETSMAALEAMAGSVSTLRRYNGLQKVKATAELIASELLVGKYKKVVIFAIHRDVIEQLRVALDEFHPVTLYGNTPAKRRQENIDKFQNQSHCKVFIGNILSAGTAITLTASNQVVMCELDWVPANNAQAISRCHRMGQTEPVFVRYIAIADSIDEKVTGILRRKTRTILQVLNDPENPYSIA